MTHDMIDPNPMPQTGFQYRPDQGPIRIGHCILKDDSLATHRESADLTLSIALFRMEQGAKTEEPFGTILMSQAGESAANARGILDIRHTVMGDLSLDIHLDPTALTPVHTETSYTVQITAFNRRSGATTGKSLVFQMVPDKQKSALLISWRSPLAKGVSARSWTLLPEPRPEINLRSIIRFIQSRNPARQPRGEVLRLGLRNSATVAFGAPPRNTVKIKDVSVQRTQPTLSAGEPSFLFIELRSATDDLLKNNGQVYETLFPNSDGTEQLKAILFMEHTAPAALFEAEEIRGVITVKFSTWDPAREEHEDGTRTIHFAFKPQPAYANKLWAIDFGTSAIAMGYKSIEEQGEPTVSGLKEKWHDYYNALFPSSRHTFEPMEKDPLLISSSISVVDDRHLLATPKDAHSHFNGSKPTINHLKSAIATFQEQCGSSHNTQHYVSVVLESAYETLYDYFHDTNFKFSRVVLTHPNSFFDGQASFLKGTLDRVLKSAAPWNETARTNQSFDILTISESDAVTYAIVASPKAFGLNEPRPDGERTILCYDMGAGTLDISLRTLTMRNNQVVPEPEAHRFLSIYTVHGAGSALDESLAALIDEVMLDAQAIAQDEFGETVKKEWTYVPLTQSAGDMVSTDGLELYLFELRDRIREAKTKVDKDNGLTLEFPPHSAGFAGTAFSRSAMSKINVRTNMSYTLHLSDTGKCSLEIPLAKIHDHLKKKYLPDHVDFPLKAVLGPPVAGDGFTPVDEIIISGRAVGFPGIEDSVIAALEALSPRHPTPHSIPPDKRKTIVVEGALLWAQNAATGSEYFTTPMLFGTLGATLRHAGTGQWTWLPISEIETDDRAQSGSPPFNPYDFDKIEIVHTMIRNTDLISELFTANPHASFDRKHFHGLVPLTQPELDQLRRAAPTSGGAIRLRATIKSDDQETRGIYQASRLTIEYCAEHDEEWIELGLAHVTREPPKTMDKPWPEYLIAQSQTRPTDDPDRASAPEPGPKPLDA